ncbi:kinase-like protein [Rhizopogon salebrosus TDB-379]|nr:kinase-like protein [Rhizopogon salebrosus TDB-379]
MYTEERRNSGRFKCPRFPNLSEAEIAKINHNLYREISIWVDLKHQFVLPLYGTTKGFGLFPALVFPWMPNGTLNSYLNRQDGTLTTMVRLRILKQITVGLEYLHDNDIIHGDLTTNNVLVAADGSPRLADFGISNIIVASNPAFSYHTGAVRWAAPELIIVPEGQTVQRTTKSSDIYSLGCIMLQVLYGKLPYWWINTALQVVTSKFTNQEPINNTVEIQANYLNFLRRCWSTESESRPSVGEGIHKLNDLELSHRSRNVQSDHDQKGAVSSSSSAHPVPDLRVTFGPIRQKDRAADGDEESEEDEFYDVSVVSPCLATLVRIRKYGSRLYQTLCASVDVPFSP